MLLSEKVNSLLNSIPHRSSTHSPQLRSPAGSNVTDGRSALHSPSPLKIPSADLQQTNGVETIDSIEFQEPIQRRLLVKEEERLNIIKFMNVFNDGSRESLIVLTGLKNIYQKQLPKMPREYIARLVYDRFLAFVYEHFVLISQNFNQEPRECCNRQEGATHCWWHHLSSV